MRRIVWFLIMIFITFDAFSMKERKRSLSISLPPSHNAKGPSPRKTQSARVKIISPKPLKKLSNQEKLEMILNEYNCLKNASFKRELLKKEKKQKEKMECCLNEYYKSIIEEYINFLKVEMSMNFKKSQKKNMSEEEQKKEKEIREKLKEKMQNSIDKIDKYEGSICDDCYRLVEAKTFCHIESISRHNTYNDTAQDVLLLYKSKTLPSLHPAVKQTEAYKQTCILLHHLLDLKIL